MSEDLREVMICGVDCNPGDGRCNNYCNHDTSKPMADRPPEATPEEVYLRYVHRAEIACCKADAAVEKLHLLHNKQFVDGVVAGFENLAESCERRREKLNLLKEHNREKLNLLRGITQK